MSRYRRANIPGATYFFTVVSYRRRCILCDDPVRIALRRAIDEVRASRPFVIDAWVLLPDHLHCIWTLPVDDADFSVRWNMIKRKVSRACVGIYRRKEWLTDSKTKHRESTVWQRRFWEHRVRDENDFMRHVDYLHYNPVKHGLCRHPSEWPYSTFHRYVADEIYPEDWAGMGDEQDTGLFGE